MDDPMARDMFDMSNTAFLGGPTTDEAKLTEVSPARNVTENTPPTIPVGNSSGRTCAGTAHDLDGKSAGR